LRGAKWKLRHGREWSPEECQRVVAVDNEMSDKELAKELGRTVHAIQDRRAIIRKAESSLAQEK
jgi:hypothetical protein